MTGAETVTKPGQRLVRCSCAAPARSSRSSAPVNSAAGASHRREGLVCEPAPVRLVQVPPAHPRRHTVHDLRTGRPGARSAGDRPAGSASDRTRVACRGSRRRRSPVPSTPTRCRSPRPRTAACSDAWTTCPPVRAHHRHEPRAPTHRYQCAQPVVAPEHQQRRRIPQTHRTCPRPSQSRTGLEAPSWLPLSYDFGFWHLTGTTPSRTGSADHEVLPASDPLQRS